MVPDSDLEVGQLRLLDVDNRVVVPVDTHIRFIVTGQDVIHSFAVPSLGIKTDAVHNRAALVYYHWIKLDELRETPNRTIRSEDIISTLKC